MILAPYNLVYNKPIKAIIFASNANGESAASLTSTTNQLVLTVPLKPTASPYRGASTSSSQIEVDWNSLVTPADGGSTITSYQLQWDSGSGSTFSEVVGYTTPYTSLSKIITPVNPGTVY